MGRHFAKTTWHEDPMAWSLVAGFHYNPYEPTESFSKLIKVHESSGVISHLGLSPGFMGSYTVGGDHYTIPSHYSFGTMIIHSGQRS